MILLWILVVRSAYAYAGFSALGGVLTGPAGMPFP